jgi:hypothetical protein
MYIIRKSHGEFEVHVTDVKGQFVTVIVPKHVLRSVTLAGTRIFSDVVGICREKCRAQRERRERSLWARIKIAWSVLRNN